MMNLHDFYLVLQKLVPLKGKEICVALSGGADSVALLHLLLSVSKQGEFTVSAVHVNHGLRGEEAQRDANFCAALCKKLGVKLYSFSVRVLAEQQPGESTELCARRLRYRCFETLSCNYIATAHHADDAVETFLLNFTRGSGLNGLCGIPQVRQRYIRPLLGFTRQEILAYISSQNLTYVTDSTNMQPELCNRNRLRHFVVPELKKINAAFSKTAVRNFQLLRQDADFLNQTAAETYKALKTPCGLPVEQLRMQHPAMLSRILQQYLLSFHFEADHFHLSQIMQLLNEEGGGRLQLKNKLFCAVRNGYLYCIVEEPLHYSVQTKIVSAEKLQALLKINNLLFKNAIDYDKIQNVFQFRTRKAGDSMIPFGRNCTKAVRRLQAEAGIPPEQRNFLPLAADDQGIIWGAFIGVAERVAVTKKTKRVLIFSPQIEKNSGE